MLVKIYDQEFAHTNWASLFVAPQYIQWTREGEDTHTCFFTDRELSSAASCQGKIKVAWLLEPYAYHSEYYDFVRDHLDLFDFVLSFDLRILDLSPKCLFFPAPATCWILPEQRVIHPKSKLLSIVSSGKRQLPGHLLRHEIINTFGHRMDCYGPEHINLQPVAGKIEALRDYAFSIVVLNSKDNDYFNEALMDAFMTGTIPIFWGTDNIGNYFDINGIFAFNTCEELGTIIDSLSETLYMERFGAVKKNFELAQEYLVPEDWLFAHYPFLFQ